MWEERYSLILIRVISVQAFATVTEILDDFLQVFKGIARIVSNRVHAVPSAVIHSSTHLMYHLCCSEIIVK
jgi:hypothetical protein